VGASELNSAGAKPGGASASGLDRQRTSRPPRRRNASSMPARSSSGEGSLTRRRSRSRRRTRPAYGTRPEHARVPARAPGVSNGNQKRRSPRDAGHPGASLPSRMARCSASPAKSTSQRSSPVGPGAYLCSHMLACRHDHQTEQVPGWTVTCHQPVTWTTPGNRSHTASPAEYWE
jgi:hypothetical protein